MCVLGESARSTAQRERNAPNGFQGPAAQRFLDATTIAIGTAALIALQTHVKFERTKDGRFHFKIEKKPLPLDLMRKLLAYFSHGPSGKP